MNYDQEIERRYHPENFSREFVGKFPDEADMPEPEPKVRNWFNKGLKKAKRGYAKEARIIQNKKKNLK